MVLCALDIDPIYSSDVVLQVGYPVHKWDYCVHIFKLLFTVVCSELEVLCIWNLHR